MNELSLHPVLAVVVGIVVLGVIVLLGRELRKVPANLHVLMATAFIDMAGTLMVLPLMPFYAKKLGAGGFVVGMLVSSFAVAQLISAPMWGRFSDRFGRRPTLLVALSSSAMAYLLFAYANSVWLLFLSRIVQGAGGGTVGVLQAYITDATEPQDRAKALGWLSAATNLGVALGPVLGSWAVSLGESPLPGLGWTLGAAAPGLLAAILCLANVGFAWRYLLESKAAKHHGSGRPSTSRTAVLRVLSHPGDPAPRLIWIYAIAMGAFNGVTAILALFLNAEFQVTAKTIGYFFMYIGIISVLTRALILGRLVDSLGEARLSRVGTVLLALGILGISFAPNLPMLALATAFLPLGTAFTFPCVTAMLSRVIEPHERGLYLGVQQTFGGTARVALPVIAGFLFDRLGHAWPFWFSALLVSATIPLTAGLERAARKPAPAPTAP